MTYNIVEICTINDKNAHSIVEANSRLGYKVFKVGFRYMMYIATEKSYHSSDVQFKYISSGTYIFQNDQVVKL